MAFGRECIRHSSEFQKRTFVIHTSPRPSVALKVGDRLNSNRLPDQYLYGAAGISDRRVYRVASRSWESFDAYFWEQRHNEARSSATGCAMETLPKSSTAGLLRTGSHSGVVSWRVSRPPALHRRMCRARVPNGLFNAGLITKSATGCARRRPHVNV